MARRSSMRSWQQTNCRIFPISNWKPWGTLPWQRSRKHCSQSPGRDGGHCHVIELPRYKILPFESIVSVGWETGPMNDHSLQTVHTALSGYELLNDPLLNKGTAF